ncbi:unnamed protein product [Arctogadus glacialis]
MANHSLRKSLVFSSGGLTLNSFSAATYDVVPCLISGSHLFLAALCCLVLWLQAGGGAGDLNFDNYDGVIGFMNVAITGNSCISTS